MASGVWKDGEQGIGSRHGLHIAFYASALLQVPFLHLLLSAAMLRGHQHWEGWQLLQEGPVHSDRKPTVIP